MGQIVYLADETDADDLDTTFRVMASRGVHARRVHPERLALDIDRSGAFSAFCAGESLRPDLWVGWVFEDLLAPGLAILDALEACGAPVVNPGAVMFRGQNKFLMSALLNAAKVPHLPVRLAGTYADLLRAANELGFPLVVKPGLVVCGGYTRQTAGGKGVTRADNWAALEGIADALFSFRQPLYLQPMIEKPGRIVDVNVIDYEVSTATYKYAASGEWRTNEGRGAVHWEDCPIDDEVRATAVSAARAIGARIAGINLAESEQGLVVLEVNTCPVFSQYRNLYGDRTYQRVADLLQRELEARR